MFGLRGLFAVPASVITLLGAFLSMAATATFTWEEIRKHNSLKNGLWLVIHGSVYDVTHFALEHPGGGTFDALFLLSYAAFIL